MQNPSGSAHPRLALQPVDETSFVNMTTPGLPDQVFRIRLPEYINTQTAAKGEHVCWVQRGPNRWDFSWEAPQEVKRAHLRTFSGSVVGGADTVDLHVRIRNPFDRPWPAEDYWMFDVTCGQADQFHDPQGVRTYIHRDGRFITVLEAEGGELRPSKTGSFLINPSRDSRFWDRRADAKIMARVSEDGHWVLAIASDKGTGMSYNLQPATSCIHQNITWGRLQPGEEKRIHVRVYLFQGTLDDLWRRYLDDMGR